MAQWGQRRSATSLGGADRLEVFRELWRDELASAALYRALAEHADESRREAFLSLAEAEERHAAHWARLMDERGVTDLRPPRLPFRVRVLRMLARRFGADTVLPIMLRSEAADADKYLGIAEAPAAMAAQEVAHGQVVAAMSGGNTARGRIAATEHRHRARVGGALRAAVFGVQDGLLTNLALIAGIAGGTTNHGFVILAGLAGLTAGACSMATGEWVSVWSQRELYENELRIEREELAAFPEEEREELELIYRAKGIEAGEARSIVDRIMSRPDVALDTLAREELGIDPQTIASPWVAALASFVTFAVGASIPLAPYLVASGAAALTMASVLSALALFGVGAAISVFTGRSVARTGLRIVVIAAVVAATTFGIGKLVGTSVG